MSNNIATPPGLIDRFCNVELLLMDCDGVLTDGRLYFSARGEEFKVFNVRDGQGLALWHASGFSSGIISGRDAAPIIECRARELGIAYIRVKSVDKVNDFRDILQAAGIGAEKAAFIGDDVGDVELMSEVGLAIAVADAHETAKNAADFVTSQRGGHGAVREVVDLLLNARAASIN